MKAPKPKVNAMLICDSIITEAGTNKKSLIGIFENINAFKFPCVHYMLAVYIKLTDANGGYFFRLELVDLDNEAPIGKGEMPDPVNIDNPLVTHDLVFSLGNLKFEHPGKYEFRIYANDEILGQKAFHVMHIEAPPRAGA
jgi:hypothetical protein